MEDVIAVLMIQSIMWLIVWVAVFGSATAWLASERGRSGPVWFLAGVFLGPLGPLVVGLAPLGLIGKFDQCPRCLEAMRARATRCPHCQADLDD